MAQVEELRELLSTAIPPFSRDVADGRLTPSPTLMELSRLMGEVTDRYFQVEVHDIENIPVEGGAMIVSNHGFLMVETVVAHNVILRHTQRAVRPVVAHMAWKIPLFNRFAAKAGGIVGHPDTVVDLLRNDELVLIYPGGVREAAKGQRDREKLFWDGRKGFIKAALKAGRPIIPMAINGADDVYVRTDTRLSFLSNLLGDRDAAVPMFVGLGPLPLPAALTFRFGPAVQMDMGPNAADDDALVDELQARVKCAVEALLHK